jgi:micrococcal nuclease
MKHFLMGLILSLVLGACSSKPLPNLDVAMSTLDTKRYTVILDRCTDGDTARFWISGRSVAVRFLSIDTPELAKDGLPAQPYAQEAAALTCSNLQGATQIVLELDPIAGIEDQYGRWLAYVWVDDVLLQEILIEAGFADLRYAHDLSLYDAQLLRILEITQQRRIGRWK